MKRTEKLIFYKRSSKFYADIKFAAEVCKSFQQLKKSCAKLNMKTLEISIRQRCFTFHSVSWKSFFTLFETNLTNFSFTNVKLSEVFIHYSFTSTVNMKCCEHFQKISAWIDLLPNHLKFMTFSEKSQFNLVEARHVPIIKCWRCCGILKTNLFQEDHAQLLVQAESS